MALLDTPLCNFGWKAPDFSLNDPDGNSFSMRGSIAENGLLIGFISNHCPYVKAIASRLAEDAAFLKTQGINTLAIMSNDYQRYPDDAPPKMKQFAAHYGFAFPYLVDTDQSVASAYDAVCTPDFFGLNNQGELQYRGRLDNMTMGARDIDLASRTRELVEAMVMVAETGEGPRDQIPSMGCSIKWG